MPFLVSMLYWAPGSGECLRAHCTELGSVPVSFRTPAAFSPCLCSFRIFVVKKKLRMKMLALLIRFTHFIFPVVWVSHPHWWQLGIKPLAPCSWNPCSPLCLSALFCRIFLLLPPGSAFPFHLPHLIFSFLPFLLRVIGLPILFSFLSIASTAFILSSLQLQVYTDATENVVWEAGTRSALYGVSSLLFHWFPLLSILVWGAWCRKSPEEALCTWHTMLPWEVSVRHCASPAAAPAHELCSLAVVGAERGCCRWCGRGNTAEGQLVLAGSSWLILSLKRILFLTTNPKFAQKNLCRAYIFLKKWWTATSLRFTENSDMESVFI